MNQVCQCGGLFVDRQGFIYYSDPNNYRVVKITPFTMMMTVVAGANGNGTAGSNLDQLNNPGGIYVDTNNTLYVADTSNNRVMMYLSGSSQGTVLFTVRSQYAPYRLTLDKSGNIYVTGSSTIYRFIRPAGFLKTIVSNAVFSGGIGPQGIQLDTSEYLIDLRGLTHSTLQATDNNDLKSSEEDLKKLRSELSSIENLSNEIFYEIFDYLDGLDICIAFSNLNYRFQQLIICSPFRYKINLGYSTKREKFLNNYKQIQHQIYSISFIIPKTSMNELLISFQIDCSFNNLQSIRIDNISKDKLISLLVYLSELPCLHSLNIQTTDSIEDLNYIYQLIFSLPKLKSNELSSHRNEDSISILMPNNNQISPIEYLKIAHSYTFDELNTLISYTPNLRRLNLSHANIDDSDIEDMLPMNLNNLIHLSIFTNSLNFDEFELFIEKMNSKLKSLRVIAYSNQDITYLYADRWQKLISENFSQLEKFSLCFDESRMGRNCPIYDGGLNQFSSPFWIQRNLIFDIEIYEYNIHYYVRSYKYRWYNDINSSHEHSKSTQLTIKYVYTDEPVFFLLDQIKRVLNFTQIYHLNIEQQITEERLMQIIHLLPDLITINLYSLSFYEEYPFLNQGYPTTSALEHAKNIKYVYLDQTSTIKDIYFLMSFCPQMEYLSVECIKNMNIQLFLKDILKEINQKHYEYLHLLCIFIRTADDQMIKQLNQMIYDEKLLLDYTIHRRSYNIYLKWK
ncbi:unnamed protein product [Adineta steineri]|uniref:NHL repeat containing protein n=1 Tax=Adineta steineri TaxID=433720 RepID=A0A815JPT0_9BILA|nr:unnamed protein product [Adineta steineri]CAF3861981.1 unnamed protein product [Adineta steineri]